MEDTATAHIKFKNGATGLFFATNSNFGNSSVELQVVFENGKFTIKDSILTKVNEEGKKERMVEDAKLAWIEVLLWRKPYEINQSILYLYCK